ncbi:hypothetical protein L873DRAFT_979010 [Choiromyces venosus 120613-1]|uniref:Uncharacterized protein n=1 Tax=Choiromyces venosus 120613-1 TaxID=1336337 RepID=A0A3N4IWK1_9PEZI|nr:hypothetical protein L873DRAFT_979010 [Choiromyces venosus 120613-1]
MPLTHWPLDLTKSPQAFAVRLHAMLKPLEPLSHQLFISIKYIHHVKSSYQDHQLTVFEFPFNAVDVCPNTINLDIDIINLAIDTIDLAIDFGIEVVRSMVLSPMVIPNSHTSRGKGSAKHKQPTSVGIEQCLD